MHQALDRDVFIEIGPMDPDARTKQLPMAALANRAFGQTRVPGNRDRHDASVAQFDDEFAVSHANVANRRRFRCHA